MRKNTNMNLYLEKDVNVGDRTTRVVVVMNLRLVYSALQGHANE